MSQPSATKISTDAVPKTSAKIIQPGSTLGVLGSGQLGRMFAMAAKEMGYIVHVYSTESNSPAGQVADVEFVAPFDDLSAIAEFSRPLDVLTLEFENIPAETIKAAEQFVDVHPGANVLHTTQNRRREKTFLRNAKIDVADFAVVQSLTELQRVGPNLIPGVLKTTAWGYDGKGQILISQIDEIESAWNTVATDEAILERFVDFKCEISVIAARNVHGDFVAYPPFRNDHRDHILDVSISPSGMSDSVTNTAVEISRKIMERLNAIGVLCVEFFVTHDDRVVVNEIAPRPHNSGHLTVDAHQTSQFEQQVRAVCGLPLGSTVQHRPAAMVNLLGDCWSDAPPNWSRGLSIPNVKLHLYGKSSAKPGRKMGHFTALADSPDEAIRLAREAREAIGNSCS